ncbi:hypothetical protein EKE94_01790 [Mesobaculum littorinae]|uniref:AsmA-like C-terminal region n=1 Tax=Mesobaculum littorinae TaxID=2486419 RepID=A0A438AL98_9RHOB|nr:AsmA-like C-terminal region-containing protein [Mesobaculum littorinae]RVV99442.1 hypothetical protein EKE94_01790 [Mesobaculum littorinae]
MSDDGATRATGAEEGADLRRAGPDRADALPLQSPGARRRGRRGGWARLLGLWSLLILLILAILLGIAALALIDRRLTLPDFVTDRIEARVNAGLAGPEVAIGRIEVYVDRGGVPRVALRDAILRDAGGAQLADLSEIGATLSGRALLSGDVQLRRLRIAGAHATLRRTADGQFLLSLGGGGQSFNGLGPLLDGVDAAFAQPLLAALDRISATDLAVTLEDARTARVWQISGDMQVRRGAEGLTITLEAALFNGTDDAAEAGLVVLTSAASGAAQIAARVDDVPARDIALQSPALAFLEVLDAPISARFRTDIGEDAATDAFHGALTIGAGALRPTAGAEPVPFDSAYTAFDFDPARDRLTLQDLSVTSQMAAFTATGHADLGETGADGWPAALVAQLSLGPARARIDEIFGQPVAFAGGAADLRVRRAPFSVEIGQLVLRDDAGRDLRARGRITAQDDGWEAAIDATAAAMPVERVTALWPVPLASKTRQWLTERITAGTVEDVDAAVRLSPGGTRRMALDFGFRDAAVRYMPDMPPLTGGAGYVTIAEDRFTLVLDEGEVAPETGGVVQMGGSVMVIPDMREKPALGEFTLTPEGDLTAMLEILDRKPIDLFKSGPPPDLGHGRVAAEVAFSTRMKKGVRPEEVTWQAQGEITGFTSDTLVDGRRIEAPRATLSADRQMVSVAGAGTLEGVPLDIRWQRAVEGNTAGASTVTGQVELSADSASRLGIALPQGLIRGRGTGQIRVDLAKDTAPSLRLTSDLAGVGLGLDALGWAKSPGAAGALSVEATLGATPSVERLEVSGGGLRATGGVTLRPGGGLEAARFDRVVIGDWLDAPVTLQGRGAGVPPAIAVRGGRFDLRAAPFGDSNGGGARGGSSQNDGGRGPVDLALDRAQITGGIALTQVRGRIAEGQALSGVLDGRLNGGVPVRATLAGAAGGVSVRVESPDAGGAVRDAGFLQNLRGGRLDLMLNPAGAPGSFDGTLKVTDTRLVNAPTAAEIISAISVVGLIEQLEGQGIVFDEVTAEFRLSPDRLTLYRSSAVGASLGISLDGVYDLASKRLNMQGVVSPIYLINRIGSVLTRRGEGLLGVNFKVYGPASGPGVSVNPLSLFTPGMFREIFRRPAPQRPETMTQ